MTNSTAFFLGSIYAGLLCLTAYTCSRDKPAQPSTINNSRILYEMAVSERKQAEVYLDSARNIQAKRDTLYIERKQVAAKHDSIIRQLPPDQIIPARLDSCIEVGQIVLGELKECVAENKFNMLAINKLQLSNSNLDSSRTELAEHLDAVNREVVKQRNGKRFAWVLAGAFAVASIVF